MAEALSAFPDPPAPRKRNGRPHYFLYHFQVLRGLRDEAPPEPLPPLFRAKGALRPLRAEQLRERLQCEENGF